MQPLRRGPLARTWPPRGAELVGGFRGARSGERARARGRLWLAVRIAICAIVAALVLAGGTLPEELRVRQAVGPYAFRLLDWELARIGERAVRIGAGLVGRHAGVDDAGRQAAAAYFAASAGAREPIRAPAEAAIERGLTAILSDERLVIPMPLAPQGDLVFPPVSFSFVSPPQVLIVSRRDRIAVEQSELLRPDVTLAQTESLETAVDSQGVSSLVVPIGGLATYPAMVLEGTRPLDSLVGVAHEWIHGYLFFHPLGQAYWSSPAARAINETATEMASRELGRRLLGDLGLAAPNRSGAAPAPQARPSGRDFRSLMRATRVTVDALLAEGKVEAAEAYMRERRDELVAAGYEIRKLNQAYFAFHGSYGDAAAGASPIPGRLQRLREVSPTVGEFLRRVARLADADDLARAVGDA